MSCKDFYRAEFPTLVHLREASKIKFRFFVACLSDSSFHMFDLRKLTSLLAIFDFNSKKNSIFRKISTHIRLFCVVLIHFIHLYRCRS